jgi:hypothetical protein
MSREWLGQSAGKENMTVGNSQISWVTGPEHRDGSGKKPAGSGPGVSKDFSVRLNAVQAEIAGSGKNEPSSPVFLGRLTREAPTVSHLLVQGPYSAICWDVLSETVNADKPFTRIPEGEAIFMDPDTREILWGDDLAGQTVAGPGNIGDSGPVEPAGLVMAASHPQTDLPAVSLDTAAARFMGTAYERMNCYELVVAGLETMGVQYRGREGLGRYLVNRAVNDGMAVNHHLTGEGVTRAISRDLHVTTFHRINQVDAAVDKAMRELSGKLAPGQILSFSTPTRGHTGIVSRKGDVWTFINAGVMDNPVAGGVKGKAVGEEHLAAEIRNWVARAHREGAGLHITLGTPDPARLARFQSGEESRFSSRA